jgi:hypothetical protein
MSRNEEPMVRKSWLLAMLIVGVTLMALAFTFCGGADVSVHGAFVAALR